MFATQILQSAPVVVTQSKAKSKVPSVLMPDPDKLCDGLLSVRAKLADLEQQEKSYVAQITAIAEPLRQQVCQRAYAGSINLNGAVQYQVQNAWFGGTVESIRAAFGCNTDDYFDTERAYSVAPENITADAKILDALKLLTAAGVIVQSEKLAPKAGVIAQWTGNPEMQKVFNECGLRPRTMLKEIKAR